MQVKFDRDAYFYLDPTHPQNTEVFHLQHTHGGFVNVPDWLADNEYFQQFVAQGSAVIVEIKSVQTTKPPSAEPSDIDLRGVARALDPDGPKVRIQKPETNLDDMGRNDLVDYARKNNIPVKANASRPDVLEAIRKAQTVAA